MKNKAKEKLNEIRNMHDQFSKKELREIYRDSIEKMFLLDPKLAALRLKLKKK